MRLILSGGGGGEKSIEMDKLFASLINKSKPLLYIPIAIDEIKHPYPKCLKWLRSTFDKFGVNIYDMWTEEDIPGSKSIKPNKFGGIYLGGGNTFYLLKTLKESGFLEFLRRAIKVDIPIYGSSAGAIIFGKSILTSTDENFVGLTDFSGMNLLKNMGIFCHYKHEKEERVNEMLKNFHFKKIIALSEKTGIYVHNNKIMVIGKESAFLFSGKDKVEIRVGKDYFTG